MYNLLRFLFRTTFQIVFRWQVKGVENIPKNQGVIIAANHISLWDPPVIGCAVPGKVHFMAKQELFKIPVFGWIISRLNAFPVKRGTADRNAIREAINRLRQGNVLGIFPEGTRSKKGTLGAGEPGVALIALKAGVPVVPTAVIGTNQVLRNGKILPRFEVIFGKPIYFNETQRDNLEIASDLIMREIGALLANRQSD
ncbi:lysophospholipid acyltransferase family protein [Acetonema longum]|uniref:1-acyl-sn-glycerol-3-phosphate acyltransferase n=1 Tax=Acetonema longum DSM 6540 TaxID=1009370 RepID=F7NGC4_9FIRM|nr:lysophospholipid acyltransferase family protein [Acetonema longum]EGO64917.1 1-acylglycerol-3-phosphate O-acyltransferase [Acetonema longum DSM 6540]